MVYLLDANVFIQAKNFHYGLDFCSAFWDWLIANNQQQKVFSIEKVGDEIQAGNDELAKWADQRGPDFFLKPNSAMLSALGKVSVWATEQGCDPAAVSTFFQVADYYLVAFAEAHKHTIVTHEIGSPSTKKIKIPTPVLVSRLNVSRHMKCCAGKELASFWDQAEVAPDIGSAYGIRSISGSPTVNAWQLRIYVKISPVFMGLN